MREKLYDWKIDDYLKTPEERAAYIEAAVEENDLEFLAQALADVAKAAGNPRGAAIMAALATCIGAAVQMHGSGAARPPREAKPKRKAAKRQPAKA